MALLFFYLFLALGVSFLCSLVESGILSLTQSQVAAMVKENRAGCKILENMKVNIERPLAAILTLNTIAHTVGAAGVGAQSLKLWQDQSVAITSAILTILILVFSEIIPKTAGAVYAKKLAPLTAYCIKGMIILTYPLVVVFQSLSRRISGSVDQQQMTRQEFALLAELGLAQGALQDKEYRIIRNLLRLRKLQAQEIMTPRTVVKMFDQKTTVQEVIDQHTPLRFSRLPIYHEGLDDITGMVLRPDIYKTFSEGHQQRLLEELVKPLHMIPETTRVDQVLSEFVQRGEHIFLVVDEYGGTAGIITLEDAIETLLGEEIVDETDMVADMRQLAGSLFREKLHGRRF